MSADGSIRTAEGTSRKRRRMSPASPAETSTIKFASMPDYGENGTEKVEETAQTAHTGDGPCQHEQTLRTLHSDLDAMRQIITCTVCHRFMYQPYALSCGHTYCYSCLAEWLGKNHKKSCPDCRKVVKQEPTPSFLIREMVLVFVNRNQLLPDGETSEEHHQMAAEEAAIVAKDKADTDERQGGLFKGSFSRPSARPVIAVHDTSDHVDRCPNCLHEVEDGWCLTCHIRVRSSDAESDASDNDGTNPGDETDLSEELDLDLEAQDMAREYYAHGTFSEEDESDEDSEAEEEPDLSGFVEDEVRWDSDADEPDYSFEAYEYNDTPQASRGAAIVVSDASESEDDSEDDDDEVRNIQPIRRRLVNRRSAPVTISSDSEDDSEDSQNNVVDDEDEDDNDDDDDDDAPVPSNSQRVRRRRNEFAEVETEDEVSSSAAPSDDDSDGTTRPGMGGVSPLHYNFSPVHDFPYPNSESSRDERSDDGRDEDSAELEEFASEEDSDGSEHSTATGWDFNCRLVLFDHQLTIVTDTQTEFNPGHRLETLIQRRNRFTNPPPYALPGTSFRRSPVRLARVPRQSQGTSQARAPSHPFNLESTLARITAATRNQDVQAALHPARRQPPFGAMERGDWSRDSAAIGTLRTRPAARGQARNEHTTALHQNRRAAQNNRRSCPVGASRRVLGVGREESSSSSPAGDSSSSRTARESDTSQHLIGAMGDMSEGSSGM